MNFALRKVGYEKLVIIFLTVLYLVGVWYGFPSTSIVFDEMFPGSVLRAMSSLSFLPQGTDVLYGTVTYFLNYLFIAPVVFIVGLLNGLNASDTKLFFIENTWSIYLIARLVSVASVVCIMLWVRDILVITGSATLHRIIVIVLTMSNLIVFTTFHTSKVWVVTCALLVGSLRYFLLALTQNKNSNHFLCGAFIFSAIATANFPLAGVFSVTLTCWVAYLIYQKRIDMPGVSFLRVIMVSAVITVGIILLNWNGVLAQLKSIVFDYTLSNTAQATNLSILESFNVNIIKLFLVAPLIVAAHTVSVFFRSKKKTSIDSLSDLGAFWYLLLINCFVYFITIVIIARWSLSPEAYLRYIIPVCLLAGISLGMYVIADKYDRVFHALGIVLCTVSLIYTARSSWLLSIPTTYNIAVQKIVGLDQGSDMVIINNVSPLLSLKQSTTSYEFNKHNKNYICGTRCQVALDQNLRYPASGKYQDFSGIFIEGYLAGSQDLLKDNAIDGKQVVELNTKREGKPFSVGGGMELEDIGSYFSVTFWGLERLGKNIYSIRK